MRKGLNSILSIVISLVFIAASVFIFTVSTSDAKKVKTYPHTNATITQIYENRSISDNTTDYDVFVQYTVDGKTYEEELGQYVSGYRAGLEVEIAYNPDDPTEILATGNSSSVLRVAAYAIPFVAGVIMLLASVRRLLMGR